MDSDQDGDGSYLIENQKKQFDLDLMSSGLEDERNGCFINLNGPAHLRLAQDRNLKSERKRMDRNKIDDVWYLTAYKEKQSGVKFDKRDNKKFDLLGLYRNKAWVTEALAHEVKAMAGV
jgi:hypothetical protein